jgi:hypothetical protein
MGANVWGPWALQSGELAVADHGYGERVMEK